ncbi:hypothetical protein [Novipirellula artificiosorum]|nr:hypothetical protein [Novipirellula artificiosorum]
MSSTVHAGYASMMGKQLGQLFYIFAFAESNSVLQPFDGELTW